MIEPASLCPVCRQPRADPAMRFCARCGTDLSISAPQPAAPGAAPGAASVVPPGQWVYGSYADRSHGGPNVLVTVVVVAVVLLFVLPFIAMVVLVLLSGEVHTTLSQIGNQL